MSTTPRLGLTELNEAAAGNHIRVNEALRRMEQGAALSIISRSLTAPPGGESEGDAYIPAATATGDWAGQEGKVAYYVNGAWAFIEPVNGLNAFFVVEKASFAYSAIESLWYPLVNLWSTSEYWTGRYGSGGTKLYRKCFSFALADHPSSANLSTAHGVTGINRSQLIEVHASINNTSTVYKVPQFFSGISFEMRVTNANLVCTYTGNLSAYTCQAYIEYEKT